MPHAGHDRTTTGPFALQPAFSCDMHMVAAVTRETLHVAPLDDSHRVKHGVGSARPRRGTCPMLIATALQRSVLALTSKLAPSCGTNSMCTVCCATDCYRQVGEPVAQPPPVTKGDETQR